MYLYIYFFYYCIKLSSLSLIKSPISLNPIIKNYFFLLFINAYKNLIDSYFKGYPLSILNEKVSLALVIC